MDYGIDASYAVHLPEGEYPPGVNVRCGVDNDIGASRAIRLPEPGHPPGVNV